jgi:LuxR family transcriptional regulator, maltose regulon positive regulatory protein
LRARTGRRAHHIPDARGSRTALATPSKTSSLSVDVGESPRGSGPGPRRRKTDRHGLEVSLAVTYAKINPPFIRPGIVRRPEVVADIRASSTASVVALAAPPGYGKTTLLVDWTEEDDRPFAWVSVDEGDNDPRVLLAHIAVALDRIEPIDERVFAALRSRRANIPATVLPSLAASFATRITPVVLVLDDVDRLTNVRSTNAVLALISSVPAGSQLAVSGRALTELPLPRLRADGRLVEFGARDLAFDVASAQQLLHGVGVDVSIEEAARITDATEGWPVGLYLAGLSLRAQRPARVPAITFTGDDRYVADYVRSELLTRVQPDRLRFLTRTSILERLCGPLCDAVAGRKGSAKVLQAMEESNLLVIPLDRRREWFRYHHMLRDVLRLELRSREPEQITSLHRVASEWFEHNGLLEDAMEHARLAEDPDRVAMLFQRHIFDLNRTGRFATLHRWLAYLTPEMSSRRPSIAFAATWVSVLAGDALGAERWADTAIALSDDRGPAEGSASSRSALAMVEALIARHGATRMLEDALTAIDLEPQTSRWRPAVMCLAGIAHIALGDLDAATRYLSEAAHSGTEIDAAPATSLAFAELSLLATTRGERDLARTYAERAGDVVRSAGLEECGTSVAAFAAAARVAFRDGDHARAREALEQAERARHALTHALPAVAVHTRLELARVHLGLADVTGALTVLSEVGDILKIRSGLGALERQAEELHDQVRSFRTHRGSAPSSLTAAELRLLSILPTHLSFREIGARLFVSANTVKTQAISIYRKLGVASRSQAVERAREVGLLDTDA